jgi:hypothetical protein
MKNESFQRFAQSPNSSFLVFRRKSPNNRSQNARAYGYVCVTLVARLRQTHVVLHTSQGRFAGTELSFLKSHTTAAFAFECGRVGRSKIAFRIHTRPDNLHNLFLQALRGLPTGQIVFIFIHGLDGYERGLDDYERDHEEEIRVLVHLFCTLGSQASKRNVRFKSLLTPPTPRMTSEIVLPEMFMQIPNENRNLRVFDGIYGRGS